MRRGPWRRAGRLDLNHDVFTSNPVINEDLRLLLREGRGRLPHERLARLRPVDGRHPSGRYWRYEPQVPPVPGAAAG